MSNEKFKTTPLFIDCEQGQLFTMYYLANSNTKSECIIHIPAFFEEMNKSRHMVTKQACSFAEQGFSVLVLDLWGTGDSQGDFSNATWSIWLKNIQTAISWVQSKGINKISFWGVRAGVLLALDFLQKSKFKINQLICWQPVLNGETFIMQFLRLRVAAAMMDKKLPQQKTSDLKKQLQEGQLVEVAGYMLNPELVLSLSTVKVKQFDFLNINHCAVFELTTSHDASVNYANSQWLEHLKLLGINTTIELVYGSSFWTTQEIVEVPELIDMTISRFENNLV